MSICQQYTEPVNVPFRPKSLSSSGKHSYTLNISSQFKKLPQATVTYMILQTILYWKIVSRKCSCTVSVVSLSGFFHDMIMNEKPRSLSKASILILTVLEGMWGSRPAMLPRGLGVVVGWLLGVQLGLASVFST